MKRIAILGATGALGSHVARQAVAAGHTVSVLVRSPERLPSDVASRAQVLTGDLMKLTLADLSAIVSGNDALICCAGFVSEGKGFVELVDRVVSAVETLPRERRPVCWFLAGAALLVVDDSGRRGVDLPKVRKTYWPHAANFARLQRSDVDWRLLCPGPMVDQPPLGVERLRASTERLPVPMPGFVRRLPGALLLPLFAARIPQLIIPYADAAAFMLRNLDVGGPLSCRRVGLALPVGMTGRKAEPFPR